MSRRGQFVELVGLEVVLQTVIKLVSYKVPIRSVQVDQGSDVVRRTATTHLLHQLAQDLYSCLCLSLHKVDNTLSEHFEIEQFLLF